MMDTLPGTQLTNEWMADPWMFDPTQKSNQFSNYNNAALPWPPTYNEGNAGGPVNAATGQPIQSYQDWKAANPAGVTINNTPAQPQAPQTPQSSNAAWLAQVSAAAGGVPVPDMTDPYNQVMQTLGQRGMFNRPDLSGSGTHGASNMSWQPTPYHYTQPQAAPQQPQASGPPNNWQAAINALAMPGKVTTPGSQVPISTGSQPSGGVNQAWLQGAGAAPGMNQNFVNALRGIQNR